MSGVPSSVKRTYSDIECSPESLKIQAKKRNADYKRCFKIPEETVRFHTGLTGVFSSIQIGEFMASSEEAGSPKRSSPIAVAKSLFSDLDESGEDVFEDRVKDLSHSSITSPCSGNSNICRSLSLDSDDSMYETSLCTDRRGALQPSKPSGKRNFLSAVELEEMRRSSTAELQTPSAVSTETPKLGHFVQRGEPQCSFLNRLPDLGCSVSQSPLFLKPRNIVCFRSYCSSINRSNISGVSRMSTGSVEAMDLSTTASYHSASGTATPLQKRADSNSSLYQVDAGLYTLVIVIYFKYRNLLTVGHWCIL